MDDMRGSRDWRRLGSMTQESAGSAKKTANTRGLFFIGEEEEVELFRRTAMENGARGATLNSVEVRSYCDPAKSQSMKSNFRQLCDIIVSKAVEEGLQEPLTRTGLFEKGKTCVLRAFDAEMPVVLRRHMDTK